MGKRKATKRTFTAVATRNGTFKIVEVVPRPFWFGTKTTPVVGLPDYDDMRVAKHAARSHCPGRFDVFKFFLGGYGVAKMVPRRFGRGLYRQIVVFKGWRAERFLSIYMAKYWIAEYGINH